MPLTAAEVCLIEFVNRARLDPAGEARRIGVDLNAGLAAGTITAAAKQVLAYNAALGTAAERHSEWMLKTDSFTHQGAGGSRAGDRIKAAGYDFVSPWAWGENIALLETRNLDAAIARQHADLFRSPSHRETMLTAKYREIGVGQVAGTFTRDGRSFPASALTENFAGSGTGAFVTGVAYRDGDGNGAYGIGEGRGGIRFSIGAQSVTTQAVGIYALATRAATTEVTVQAGDRTGTLRVETGAGNVKLDVVDGRVLAIAGDATLISGTFAEARLLGVAGYRLSGSGADEVLTGNAGGNAISGGGGHDRLGGEAGNDRLYGDAGNDRLYGEAGDDRLGGGAGDDLLDGGPGHDRLWGEAGRDRLEGGPGDDELRGGEGNDQLDGGDGRDGLWGDAGNDQLAGGAGDDRLDGGDGDDRLGGRTGDDVLEGGAGDDRLWGEEGCDRLEGGAGRDMLDGGAGNDRLSGGAGGDSLQGGAGNDWLDGGSGNDRLMGDAGADTFVFARGQDRIMDFKPREGDRLQLDDALWGGGLTEAEVVRRFARVEEGHLLLDFGDGHSLVLNDFTDLRALTGVVELF